MSLYVIYVCVENRYPPKTIEDYTIYMAFSGDHYLATHRYMFPTIYASLIFLVSSLAYLQRRIIKIFEEVKHSTEDPRGLSNKSVKIACSRYRYLFAFVVGLLLLWGPSIVTCLTLNSFDILYIAFPVAAIIMFVYFLIAFLSSIGLWLILASIYFINQVAKQQFKFDINDPDQWLDDDKIGGFKQLSDFSLRIFELLVLGILIFSPAALLYHTLSNVIYFFAIIPISLFFLAINQWMLSKAIRRHKKSFFGLVKRKLDTKQITLTQYLATLLAIKSIKEKPINLSILWGIFISSIALPILFWYVSILFRDILGIVTP